MMIMRLMLIKTRVMMMKKTRIKCWQVGREDNDHDHRDNDDHDEEEDKYNMMKKLGQGQNDEESGYCDIPSIHWRIIAKVPGLGSVQ